MKLTLSSQERIDGKDTVVEERERPNIFLAGNSSPCRSTATDIKDVARATGTVSTTRIVYAPL